MRLTIKLAPAILLPVIATILAVVGLSTVLSSLSNMATVEDTLRDQQDQMIQVLAQQFSGSVRFAKMDVVTAALQSYQQQPDFGLAAAAAIDGQGKTLLTFGDRGDLDGTALQLANEALQSQKLASRLIGDFHYAAYPAYYGKDNALAGVVAMAWDVSLRRASIIAAQVQNGLIGFAIALVGLIGLALFLVRYVTRPARSLTEAATRLAAGDVDDAIAGTARRDELGGLARALEIFRANALKVRDMTEAEARRIVADEAARRAMMAQLRGAFGEAVDAAVDGDFNHRVRSDFADAELNELAVSVNRLLATVDRGLGETGRVLAALADADLSLRVEGQFAGAFARLQSDTNAVAEKIAEIVGRLKTTSVDLRTATGEILSGANDLSERTTKQAATIEETSAAMEQLADTVMKNADRAGAASQNAAEVRTAATAGGDVMHRANDAMQRITQSSDKISNIIGLIDDIAFQTNLLALNASVEAARAGEAGKGFAVVAIEVRRLAQSAAQASADIKGLIEESSKEVGAGSKLVSQAAERLSGMLDAVQHNYELLESIASDSQAQATAIREVNIAIRQMDEMTQHNAALVEETNAAIEQTEAQAVALDHVVDVFTLAGRATENAATTPVAARSGGQRRPQKVQPRAAQTRGNAALKADEWSEF